MALLILKTSNILPAVFYNSVFLNKCITNIILYIMVNKKTLLPRKIGKQKKKRKERKKETFAIIKAYI